MTETFERYRKLVEATKRAVFTTPGETSRTERESIASRAAVLGGGDPSTGRDDRLPAPARSYIEKVALHAHEITVEDMEALKAVGYSEDAIFEITLAAALGASVARLERGLRALRGTTS